jgi:ATPase subunit of ABC transporter with duplicated ATPase domains
MVSHDRYFLLDRMVTKGIHTFSAKLHFFIIAAIIKHYETEKS